MKIDVFKILLQNPEVRINLTQNFILELRALIQKNYKSFMDFARNERIPLIEKFNHTSLSIWLGENKKYRTAIPSETLKKMAKRFNIDSEHIFSNVESFRVWSGKKVKVPRWVEIDKEFIYGIGLYTGEGKNLDKRKYRTGITNTKIEIARFAAQWLEKYFNINRNSLRVYVNVYKRINGKNLRIFLKKLAFKLKIPEENILPMFNSKPRTPSIEIAYDSKIIRYVVEYLRDNVILLALKNKNLGIWYAKGIMDGEGHIRHDKPEIILEMYDVKALDTVELIYRNLNVFPNRSEDKKKLVIETRDFPKLEKIGVFWLHGDKLEKFNENLSAIKNIQERKNRSLFKVLKFLYEGKGFYASREVATELGYSAVDHARTLLRKAESLGYTEKVGEGGKYCPWKFKITKKGRQFVKRDVSKNSFMLKNLERNILSNVDRGVEKWVSA